MGGKVIAIELDKRMINILNDRFSLYTNFELINDDVLKVNLNDLITENLKNDSNLKKVKIVANLPYYITTPIIMKLLEDKLNIDSITVMVQKEVAQRLSAEPGGKLSGAITYSVNYYCKAEEIIVVPNSSFIPEPDVNSEVIKLNVRKKAPIEVTDEKLFFKLVKASFMQRRKTLVNGITNSKLMTKPQIIQILNELNLDQSIRGENLSMQDFANIVNKYILLFT